MGLIQTSRQSSGGGSGNIAGYQNDQFNQETNFTAESVILTLTQIPFSFNGLIVSYNGRIMRYNVDWTPFDIDKIVILFADPYVTTYSDVPYFELIYPYS